MWKSLQRLIQHNAGSLPAEAAPAVVPLRRKSALPFGALRVGHAIVFSEACPLPQLRARSCPIRAERRYKFGNEEMKSYQLVVEGSSGQFAIAVAEDADGHYLAITRQLSEAEQDVWFGRDALGFFTEPSTAKTIRCKADKVIEAAWAGERYLKTVDWVEGSVSGEGRGDWRFHYNLLISETGEKAIEIEHYDATGKNNIYATIYRPVEDILTISETVVPITAATQTQTPEPTPVAAAPVAEAAPKQRPDFRRTSDPAEAIHIPTVTEAPASPPAAAEFESVPLPAFLMTRDKESTYLSLDEVIPPEPERVRCSVLAAKALIDVSLQRGVRVRDVLRDLLGLDSALSEEVLFELPLTEKDYRTLAQRYKLRPDHRDEIRARLQEELRKKLLS